jgi:hypothetical protein
MTRAGETQRPWGLDRARAVAMHLQGKRPDYIAAQLGRSEKAVRFVLNRLGHTQVKRRMQHDGEGIGEPLSTDKRDGRPKIGKAAADKFRAAMERHLRHRRALQQRSGIGVVGE